MKKDVIQNIKLKLKAKGANLVRTSSDKSDNPKALSYKGGKKSYTPDLVAVYDQKVDLFSVENKISKSHWPDLISKWILFSLEARRRGGHFYIVVKEKNEKQCKEVIDSKRLSALLITI